MAIGELGQCAYVILRPEIPFANITAFAVVDMGGIQIGNERFLLPVDPIVRRDGWESQAAEGFERHFRMWWKGIGGQNVVGGRPKRDVQVDRADLEERVYAACERLGRRPNREDIVGLAPRTVTDWAQPEGFIDLRNRVYRKWLKIHGSESR